MQTVYIGNTLINDVFVGSQKITDVATKFPTIVTSGLTAYFDASYSASAANWRATGQNFTASLNGVKYNSTFPQTFNPTSSVSNITYGTNDKLNDAELSGTGARTIMTFINPTSSSKQNIIWYGSIGSSNIQFFITSGSAGQNYLQIQTTNGSGVGATLTTPSIGSVNTNNWQMAAYTTNGTNDSSAFEIWLNGNKAATTGSVTWNIETTGGRYWETSTISGLYPYYGNIAFNLVYNRKLTDNEILQNYQYFKYRFGLV